MVDPDHARNYWRSVFVGASQNGYSKEDFDKWFPGTPTGDTFLDELAEAFDKMIEACAGGTFGVSERGR